MNSDHIDDIVARVVVWHNRHPLAQRVAAAQVHGVGVVTLPYALVPAATPAPSVAARWRRLLARRPARLFSEDFLVPLSVRRIGRWAAKHGQAGPCGHADWPQRAIPVDPLRQARNAARRGAADSTTAPAAELRHVLTAAIEVDGKRLRVLIAPVPPCRVIGPRHWSVPRLGAAAAMLVVLSTGSALAVLRAGATASERPSQLVASASAAARTAPAVASARAAASTAPGASAPVTRAEASPHPQAPDRAAERAHAEASAPVKTAASGSGGIPASILPVAPEAPVRLGRIAPPLPDDVRLTALKLGRTLRAASPPTAPTPPAAAASGPALGGRLFALVMRPTAQRAESLAMLSQLHAAAANVPALTSPHTELMQVNHRWIAVWWPFGQRQDAEAAQRALSARGLKASVTEF